MSVSNFVALRYLKSSRENRYFSWITILSVSGISIGVAALIVVLSVINGFETELRKRFLHANAHIMAYRYPAGMVSPQKWSEIIKKDFPESVQGISPFVHYETMLKNGSIMHGVLVRGISPKEREKVQSLAELVSPFRAVNQLKNEVSVYRKDKSLPQIPGLIVGSGLAKIIDAKIGDTVNLVSPTEQKYTEMKPFKITGIYNSGLKHYDNRLVIMSLSTATNFFQMKEVDTGRDIVTGLEIGLHDADQSVAITEKMREKYNLTFREWQSFNKPLFDAMKQERQVIVLIVALVVLVAGFNILTTIFVSVSQKQKDISILKSLGASNNQILKLFISQGVYIGLIGCIFGCILALGISLLLEHYQFIDLPDPYFIKHLPVNYELRVYGSVSLAAIVVCIVAGIYPAMVAAQVQPSEGFREPDTI